jgi:hypothetical protein
MRGAYLHANHTLLKRSSLVEWKMYVSDLQRYVCVYFLRINEGGRTGSDTGTTF